MLDPKSQAFGFYDNGQQLIYHRSSFRVPVIEARNPPRGRVLQPSNEKPGQNFFNFAKIRLKFFQKCEIKNSHTDNYKIISWHNACGLIQEVRLPKSEVAKAKEIKVAVEEGAITHARQN